MFISHLLLFFGENIYSDPLKIFFFVISSLYIVGTDTEAEIFFFPLQLHGLSFSLF